MIAAKLLRTLTAAVVSAAIGSLGAASAPAGPSARPHALVEPAARVEHGCHPAQVLDLMNWKVQLPLKSPTKPGSVLEVLQPELAGYDVAPWFETTPVCHAVVFRAPVNGATTKNSRNPRSELREMTDNGSRPAGWSSTVGTHTLVVTEAFRRLPAGKPHLVGAQIHDADDDVTVFRLEGSNLYITNGDDTHYKLVTSDYVLDTPFEAKYVVSGGKIRVYYNGILQTTLSGRHPGSYFKAGAYTQANCSNSAPCDAGNYGETVIYSMSLDHRVTRWDHIRDWATYDLPIGVAVAALTVQVTVLLRNTLRGRSPRGWSWPRWRPRRRVG